MQLGTRNEERGTRNEMDKSFEEKRIEAGTRLGIDPQKMPRHIAIIMDGNGRWARQRGLPRFRGHEAGGKVVEKIAQHCVDIGIEYLSLYSFSMQNWKRPADEVEFLMHLYVMYLKEITATLMEDNVKLLHIGREVPLSDDVLDAIRETEKDTQDNTGMILGLALNYGARTEIVDAARKIAKEYKDGKIREEEIDEDCVSDHLYTAGWRDPDMVIRTSGEMRISNFLLWQISYAEFHVADTMWPDFSESDLDEAVRAYAQRSRCFGDVKSKASD